MKTPKREASHLTHGMSKTRIYKIWAEITGIFEGVLAYRVRENWDIEDIFNVPVGTINNYKTKKQIERG